MPREKRLTKGALRHVWLCDEDWDALRIAAAKRRTNITALVGQAVADWLRAHENF